MRYRKNGANHIGMDAFRELNGHLELSRIVLHRQGDWTFVAERQTSPKEVKSQDGCSGQHVLQDQDIQYSDLLLVKMCK